MNILDAVEKVGFWLEWTQSTKRLSRVPTQAGGSGAEGLADGSSLTFSNGSKY